jgi:small subunit ribosomal protein S20
MPILESSRKALRRDQRRTVVNRKIKEKIKLVLKTTRKNPTLKNLAEAARFLDRAAKKKVIHPQKASRLKSRLSKLLKTKKG